MSLGQFKVIYWWEWTHRLLARTTGAVFLLPFLFFLWRGAIPPPLRTRLWTIFAAGALLGVVGWWMVASGLSGTLTKVSQYRLAFHLTLGLRDLCGGAVDRAADRAARRQAMRPGGCALPPWRLPRCCSCKSISARWWPGSMPALKYNTWPTIDGAYLPSLDRLLFIKPLWRNLFENDLTVQFNHRMLADAIWLLAVLHAYRRLAARRGGARRDRAGGRGDAAGRARHRHAALSGAGSARARASDRWPSWFSRSRWCMPSGCRGAARISQRRAGA